MNKHIQITESDIERMVMEAIRDYKCTLNEDMTYSQVRGEIEDYAKGKDFEKKVHNIVVDTLKEFIENMWTRKSFWATMLKKK